jgi:hypothetical protein
MKTFFLKISLVILIISLFSSCRNDDQTKTPEEVLSEFINIRTTQNVDMEFYQKYTSGILLAQIESLEENEKSEIGKKIEIRKKQLKLLKTYYPQANQCFITYLIKYDVPTENPETSSEVKKIAELHKIENQWKIVDVVNVKTFYENKQALDIGLNEK